MYTYLATGLIAASLSATGAWKVQDWRYTAKEKERAELQLENERLAAKTAIRRVEAVVKAQNAAAHRERDLRNAAAGARDESDRLRTSRDEAVRIAAASHNACLERIDAFSVVLGTVEAAGREVAAQADRLHSDRQTLIDAWPR